MFCLFRNSQIEPRLNRYVVLLSMLGVIGWLYFSFIEKSLASKLFEGQALLVDLVFGLPLVLMLAVVVYATIYWACKLIIMFLLPNAIILKSAESLQLEDELNDEEIKTLEETHGEDYWKQSNHDQAGPADQANKDSSKESKPRE
ncbi:MAG: hypothetical protein ISEC1_P1917 [Thiomicrorhabdus sp.]|nr:MAG: hypothetical protein ISEC1_P1917 [Thiomicrorhabdus sp.]